MTDNNKIQAEYQPSTPNPDLESLDRLIGTWKQSGGIEGEITSEWTECGFFLTQLVDLESDGRKIEGMEVIGHLQLFGEEPSKDIKSRFYSFLDGMILDYVYEGDGDTRTIWGGAKGSPAYYKGTLSDDGDTLAGGWVYPGGGRYEATTTRAK